MKSDVSYCSIRCKKLGSFVWRNRHYHSSLTPSTTTTRFILWTLSLSLLLVQVANGFTRTTTAPFLPRRQLLTTATTQVNLLPPHFLTSIIHYNHINAMKNKKTVQAQKSKKIKIHQQQDHRSIFQEEQHTSIPKRRLKSSSSSHHKNMNIESLSSSSLASSSSSSSLLLLSSLSSSAAFAAASPTFALPSPSGARQNLGKMFILSLLKLTTAISMSRYRLGTAALISWTRAKSSWSRNAANLLSLLSSIRQRHHVITNVTLLSMIMMGLFGYAASLSSSLLSSSSSLTSISSLLSSILAATVQAPVAWYLSVLAQYPLVTKSVTSGVIGTVADFMAQKVEHGHEQKQQQQQRQEQNVRHKNKELLLELQQQQQQQPHRYDVRRGVSRLADGCLASGPMMHFAYEFMEHVLPIASSNAATVGATAGAIGMSSTMAAITHVLADTIILDSIFVATTFLSTGFLEGYSPKQLWRQFQKDYIPAVKVGWLTSFLVMPIEVACFRFFPLSFRVLAVDMIDILWDSVMSFMMHRNRQRPSSSSQANLLPDNDNDINNDTATLSTAKAIPQYASSSSITKESSLLPGLAAAVVTC